jgi:hypothetical protein
MTKEELNQLKELYQKFEMEAERVAEVLKGINGSDICFADEFTIEDNNVYWTGTEYCSYGCKETHIGSFPIDYLTMSNEALKAIVEYKNIAILKEKKEEEFKKKEKDKERMLAQYNRLKEELGL